MGRKHESRHPPNSSFITQLLFRQDPAVSALIRTLQRKVGERERERGERGWGLGVMGLRFQGDLRLCCGYATTSAPRSTPCTQRLCRREMGR